MREIKMNKLQEALKKEKLIFGSNKILKLLRNGKLKVIFLASNVREDIKGEVEHLAKLGKTEIVNLDMPNSEVGVICKKPFSISVLGY